MCSAKNVTPKTSWICLLPVYHGAPVARSQTTKGLSCAERELTSRGLLAIPAFILSLSSVRDTNYNWDFAYAKEFLFAVDELDMDKMKTIS